MECASRRNYTDKRDFCIYCEKDVTHFVRHLTTWHQLEFDVQQILSFPNNSKERRVAVSNLRKRGNFIQNRSRVKLRPVKRLQSKDALKATVEDFLPCKYCLGFYKKKSLYRHSKKCPLNNVSGTVKRQTSQSDGQTTLLLNSLFKHDKLLTNELFPRMRADDIGLIARQDYLICRYAYSYLKGRRSKGNIDLVRQNMRRLAKLLKYAREKNNQIKKLIDLLQPSYFKLIIEGVNRIASYNEATDKYESPTLAVNFGTLLKKCCDLAYIELLQQKNSAERREDLNILKTLIKTQWADEVSTQAGANLSENKWNKNELLPLTSDLKKMSNFLQIEANAAYNDLQTNPECMSSYNRLKEALYAQIILLNRRRPAEVAQLKVQTYKAINFNDNQEENEFKSCLTETEKILLNSYTRFVIRGKRGRGVPVLLSPQMKNHFEYLLKIRDRFISENDYIFHTDGKCFIDGTKVIRKFSVMCKLERPQSITATNLRKHLATITQLLQFSNNDMEQLSKFMGHTLKTHCNVYRMSDNLYQTAKVSKLLLLMMKGGAEQFKGKQLDDINFDLDPILDDQNIFEMVNSSTVDSSIDENTENTLHDNKSAQLLDQNKQISGKKLPTKTKIFTHRQTWSSKHKKIIAKYFKEHIKTKTSPKKHEIEEFIEKYPELKDVKWTTIKAIVYNIYTKKLKI